MAEPRDDRVSAAYRELPGEGPPPALDAAIHAAARRAVGSRPGGARRWQIPVSIAAVLALAIGVSLHVDREKPMVVDGTPVPSGSAEYPVPQAPAEKEDRAIAGKQAAASALPASAPREAERASAPAPATTPPEAKRAGPETPRAESNQSPMPLAAPSPAPMPLAAPSPAPKPPAAPAPAPAAAIVVPAPPVAPAAAGVAPAPAEAARAAPRPALRAKSEMTRDAASQEKVQADALEAPEKRLGRIAELRARGQHDEADRLLVEFRRTYPAYRISEEWLKKVERQ